MCGEVSVFTLTTDGDAVHLGWVLLGPDGKCQCAMEKQQQARTPFLQLVCFDGFTLCRQNKSDVRDAGAGRLKLARETWRRKVVCREHCLKAYNFRRSCLQECCRRGGMMISGGCTGCTLAYTPICGRSLVTMLYKFKWPNWTLKIIAQH